uniref:Uncharacterized protein n=1 Tax=Branchiostoma floridae TaxID=7739 RepID=C3Y536_BRAFL|eukprot:XP_002608559.1 hypothetical protein BRAFLDRAFT_98903 [Branchiostoma floridae]
MISIHDAELDIFHLAAQELNKVVRSDMFCSEDFAEGKAESQGGTLTTASHTYFSRTYWPWTTDEETPEPDVQDDRHILPDNAAREGENLVANEEIFLRAYLRPANQTHYSRIVGCDLYRDEHRDTMVKRLTAGGTDPGRVNMANSSDSWQFSYLLHACKYARLPNFDFDVPPVEEEAPPYHPITWLQLARNIRDWTKDYLREAFAEDPADAANTLLHPAGNTGPAETDASSVTWSHLWTEMGNKVSGVTAMFLSETPDDSATDGAPEIDPADPEPTGGVWAALQGLCTDLMNRLPSYRSDNTGRSDDNKDPCTETDFAECKAESQGGTASYSYFSRTFWPWTTDEKTPEPDVQDDFAEGKAESQGGTASYSYFSRTYWPWTTDEETPEPDVQDDPAETGWSLAAWSDHIFQAKNLMFAQIWADPPVVLDDPP